MSLGGGGLPRQVGPVLGVARVQEAADLDVVEQVAELHRLTLVDAEVGSPGWCCSRTAAPRRPVRRRAPERHPDAWWGGRRRAAWRRSLYRVRREAGRRRRPRPGRAGGPTRSAPSASRARSTTGDGRTTPPPASRAGDRGNGWASVQKVTVTSHPRGPASTSSQPVTIGIRSSRPPRPRSRIRCGGETSSITVSIHSPGSAIRKRAAAPTPWDSSRWSRNSLMK